VSKHSPAEILAIFAQIVVEHVDALHAALGKLAAPPLPTRISINSVSRCGACAPPG
jgi:hypothetical protein